MISNCFVTYPARQIVGVLQIKHRAGGQCALGEARNAINLWAEYEINDAWEVGLGGNWLGHRFADYGEQENLPSYVVLYVSFGKPYRPGPGTYVQNRDQLPVLMATHVVST